MAARAPEVYVLGGPNGSGKTTVAELVLPGELAVASFVNADFIAKAISPHAPDASAFHAGRAMLRRVHELRGRRESFAFESTLASLTFAPFLRDAKAAGYLVHVVYVFLSSAELAVHRVRLRVERGGHDIPESTVRRRYVRSLENFFRLYQPLADGWNVWDNSGETLALIAHGRSGGEVVVLDRERWERMRRAGAADGC